MSRNRVAFAAGLIALTVVARSSAGAQQDWLNEDWCRDQQHDDRYSSCEVRQQTLAPGGTLTVDASPNGGIRVAGGSRGDILVLARVVATAETESRAREIAGGIQINATSAHVSANGPGGLGRQEGWHVSYRLLVPAQSSLSLQSTNGGITVENVNGRIEFRTVNGGVKLAGLAGEVSGRSSNGGIDVDLGGSTWAGAGVDVQTSNGGVRLRIPEQYSARLEAGTRNGGMHVDFPITVQGRMNREIATNLGAGGPLIRVRTSNGGIRITKK